MGNFEIARRVLGALAAIGWGVIAISILAMIIYYFSLPNEFSVLIAFIACGLIAVFGFIIIAVAQMGLAQIETAENTGEMLQIMRGEGQPSSPITQTSTATTKASMSTLSNYEAGTRIADYKSYEITETKDGFNVEGYNFATLNAAEIWINKNPKDEFN